MGKVMSRVGDVLGDLGVSPSRIIMVGLDAAGKTTILKRLKPDSYCNNHIPTIGFNVETVNVCDGVTFTVWDVGGQEKLRRLWSLYFKGSHGILFVVDSTDRDRIPEVRQELWRMCRSDELKNVPLIVVANKQDRQGAMKSNELADELRLGEMADRYWTIHATSALHNQGVVEAMTSLAFLVKQYRKSRHIRRRMSMLSKNLNTSLRSKK